MQVYRLKINRNICTGCNVCVVSCPINFDQLKNQSFLNKENAVILVKNGIAFDIYEENRQINCDGCGVCIKNCPQNAIQLEIVEVE
jgi:ferredoxin